MVQIKPPKRSTDQNSAQWPILQCFEDQKQWPVNGLLCSLTKEEWKDVLTAAFEKEVNPRLAAGVNGGVVMLGARTSQFSKAKFSDWLEFLRAAAVQLEVKLDGCI